MAIYDINKPIRIIVGSETLEIDIESEFKVDETSINEMLKSLPNKLAHLGYFNAKALSQVKELKNEKEQLWANLYLETREALSQKGQKYTEGLLEQMVNTDKDYIELQNKLLEAERQSEILKGLFQATRDQVAIVIDLSANVRLMMKN